MKLKRKRKRSRVRQIDAQGILLTEKIGKITFSRRENEPIPNWGWCD